MNLLPENYPSSCSEQEIQKTIHEFQKKFPGIVEGSVKPGDENIAASMAMFSSMIQLGQAEIVKRKTIETLRVSRCTLIASAIAAIAAVITLIMD